MTIDTIVAWLTSLTSSALGQFAIFYVLSGLLTLLLARRSQVDAWAESHPRLAALYKALRSLGLDPWMFVQALSLALRKKLPEPPAQQVKPDDIDDDPPKPPRIRLMTLAVLLVGCGHTEPPPCDPASYAQLAATCGDDPAACDAAIEEREAFCARRIQELP